MVPWIAKRVYAYMEGLGPANAFGSAINRAPGKAATSYLSVNQDGGTGGQSLARR
jgi:hypothetical protein